jgi:hypothetical protein
MMPPRHLSCQHCRIRVLADAPEIDLLEGGCPICGAALGPVTSARGVMGFRRFDLDALSDGALSAAPRALGRPVVEDGNVRSEAAARWPAPC